MRFKSVECAEYFSCDIFTPYHLLNNNSLDIFLRRHLKRRVLQCHFGIDASREGSLSDRCACVKSLNLIPPVHHYASPDEYATKIIMEFHSGVSRIKPCCYISRYQLPFTIACDIKTNIIRSF